MSLEDKAVKIKGKDYVQVKDRIIYLATEVKDYSIETSYEYFEARKMWVVKATLAIGENVYTGLAQEIESDNYKDVNHTSALENCETSAVGRACAMAGIGVIDSIASVDEVRKAQNRTVTPKPTTLTPYQSAEKAVIEAMDKSELDTVIGQIKKSTILDEDDKNKLLKLADEHVTKII